MTDPAPRERPVPLRVLAALALVCGAVVPCVADDDPSPVLSVVGEVERVRLLDGNLVLEARIDTGATSTSVHATGIERFERDDADWVRFEVVTGTDDRLQLERRLADTVTIIGAGGEREERPVVDLELCIGDVRRRTEVNLADRDGLEYRLLIGRDLLADGGLLVNVRQRLSHEPRCDATGG